MFKSTVSNLKQPIPLADAIQGEFAISFSRLADSKHLLCLHPISPDAVIGDGKPIPFSALDEVVSSIRQQQKEDAASGEVQDFWCHQSMLYQSSDCLMWYRQGGDLCKLWFRVDGGVAVNAKLPTLVFCYSRNNGDLQIFAAVTKAVTKTTPLYHAPLCNINSSGLLCFGSAERPNRYSSDKSIINACEDSLLNSMFSHVNHNMTFAGNANVDTKAHIQHWQRISATGKMPKAKDMVKTGLTVEKLVKESRNGN